MSAHPSSAPGHTLLSAVLHAAFARRCNARVTQDAAGDVFVHDCITWGPNNAKLLRLLRPNAQVQIQASAVSLSGFVVTVREPPALCVRARLRAALVTCAALLLLVAYLRLAGRPPATQA